MRESYKRNSVSQKSKSQMADHQMLRQPSGTRDSLTHHPQSHSIGAIFSIYLPISTAKS